MNTYVKTTMYTPYWKIDLKPAYDGDTDIYHIYERNGDMLTYCGLATVKDLAEYIFPRKGDNGQQS